MRQSSDFETIILFWGNKFFPAKPWLTWYILVEEKAVLNCIWWQWTELNQRLVVLMNLSYSTMVFSNMGGSVEKCILKQLWNKECKNTAMIIFSSENNFRISKFLTNQYKQGPSLYNKNTFDFPSYFLGINEKLFTLLKSFLFNNMNMKLDFHHCT